MIYLNVSGFVCPCRSTHLFEQCLQAGPHGVQLLLLAGRAVDRLRQLQLQVLQGAFVPVNYKLAKLHNMSKPHEVEPIAA